MSHGILAADIGNSRVKFGLFASAPAGVGKLPECQKFLAFEVDQPAPWSALRKWTDRPVAAVMAGANPSGVDKLKASWPSDWPAPVILDQPRQLSVAINVDFPDRVGIDRLLNALAANLVRPADRAAIVVDSGTATTVDLISATGVFVGGAILPGLRLGGLALHQYTALLPLIEPADLTGEPPLSLGKNTRDAIRSGLFWGQLGAVRELVARLTELCAAPPIMLVTGGAGCALAPMLQGARDEPFLPLKAMVAVLHGIHTGQTP